MLRSRRGGGGTRAGLETGGAAGAGSPLYSNEWNQMLRTDGARRSETGNVRCALLTCVGLWSLAAYGAIRGGLVRWLQLCSPMSVRLRVSFSDSVLVAVPMSSVGESTWKA